MKKKRPFVPVGNTNRDKRVRQPRGRWLHLLSRLVLPTGTKGPLLSRLPDPGQKGAKGHPLLSRTGVPGWETGTTAVSQPGQINAFVVVARMPRMTCAVHRRPTSCLALLPELEGALPINSRSRRCNTLNFKIGS